MATYSTSQRTTNALICAAGELVAERGVGRVSTRAIAEKAGENLGAIHYHFGSKQELFKAMLRFALGTETHPSLLTLVKQNQDRLTTVEGQVDVVRLVIGHFMSVIFAPGRPRWCPRVIYHVLQHAGTLQDYLMEERVNPDFEAFDLLLARIRPDWTPTETRLWAYMLVSPMVFHANHIELVLDRLESKTLPDDYLTKLEQRIVKDALHAVDLPTSALQTSETTNE